MSDHRLGIVLSTATKAPVRELVNIAQLAEAHGFSAVLVNEGRGDALACSEAIALSTKHIQVGTNIANIYYRHPFLMAMTAETIADLSDGRLVLGLGISHRPLLESLGIEMNKPRAYLRSYTETVKGILDGKEVSPLFESSASAHKTPIFLAGLTVESARVAGEVADGIMPFLASMTYLTMLLEEAKKTATEKGRDADKFDCIMSIPTFLSEDVSAAMSAAKNNLAFFAQLPNYRLQWRRCGFEEEVDAMEEAWKTGSRHRAAGCVSKRMVEQICVYGSPQMCREQLAAFNSAGAAMPVLAVSPVNEDRLSATCSAIKILAP